MTDNNVGANGEGAGVIESNGGSNIAGLDTAAIDALMLVSSAAKKIAGTGLGTIAGNIVGTNAVCANALEVTNTLGFNCEHFEK